jgi:hypothetical protein
MFYNRIEPILTGAFWRNTQASKRLDFYPVTEYLEDISHHAAYPKKKDKTKRDV